MTSMNHTLPPSRGLLVEQAWSIPKEEPSPMPKITSAPHGNLVSGWLAAGRVGIGRFADDAVKHRSPGRRP
jgi:hypothetical protein